jgi:hypothetical protein
LIEVLRNFDETKLKLLERRNMKVKFFRPPQKYGKFFRPPLVMR